MRSTSAARADRERRNAVNQRRNADRKGRNAVN